MFRFLVRFLRSGSQSCEPGTRFTPRVESLDGRNLPSPLAVGAVDDTLAATHVRTGDGGTVSPSITRDSGEEIPQHA